MPTIPQVPALVNGQGWSPKRVTAGVLAGGTDMGLCQELPQGLTIKRYCLKLELLCVAFPEVFSSLPKLAHVQHRHLARLEEDLAAVKERVKDT